MDKELIPKTEAEWKKVLSPEQYRILREKGTEAPFSGKYIYDKTEGVYLCAACGNLIFSSGAKFESGTGWPSFDQALPGSIKYGKDARLGIERDEVVCARCGSHLGHMFEDGPTKTGKRYCINSLALDLKKNNNVDK